MVTSNCNEQPLYEMLFYFRMDSIKQFMEHHNVPYALQTRVKRWAHYAWSRCVTSARRVYQKIIFDKALVANVTKNPLLPTRY